MTKDETIASAKEKITDEEMKLASDTLVGDVRDALLGRIRALQKPWEKCTESEQRDIVEQMTNVAKHLTSNAVRVIAAKGRETIVAHMHALKIDKGVLEAKITTKAIPETALSFMDAQGHTILIIAADSAAYEGEQNPVEIDPDQPDLEKAIAAKSSKAKSSKAA